MTANGSAETTEEKALCTSTTWAFRDSFVVGNSTRSFIVGTIVRTYGLFPRLARRKPSSLIQDGKFIRCKSENHVPTVALSKSVAFLDLMRQETRRLILVSMRGETRRHWVLSRGNLSHKDCQATHLTLKMSW